MLDRLYLRIYLTLLGALVASALVVGVGWRYSFEGRFMRSEFAALAGEIAAELIPAKDAPETTVKSALDRWRTRAHVSLALYDAQRALIARAGDPDTHLPENMDESGWVHARHGPPAIALHLADGRWLVARHERGGRHRALGFVGTLILIALALGVVAYPVSRRLTRRLESLKAMADALGTGDLSARVPVKGNDEIASLARGFNNSADRIQALVAAQKSLLANASHELRSPLARLRMALESLGKANDPALGTQCTRDIAELDQLIDEILLASRLEGAPFSRDRFEDVDLAGLAAEECARVAAQLGATAVALHGDPILLRRLLRNLLENAARHGAGTPVEVSLTQPSAHLIELRVCDRGPGVPETERERIFEPFYRLQGASERGGSVGLGLSLVRQIARHHSGDVRCEARQGGGSCFRVIMPTK